MNKNILKNNSNKNILKNNLNKNILKNKINRINDVKYKCSNKFKQISGYFHALAIVAIAVFSGIQIYKLKKGDDTDSYWIPLGLTIMMILRLPNIICIALNDSHGWYVVIGTIIAIISNSYITYLFIKYNKSIKHHRR